MPLNKSNNPEQSEKFKRFTDEHTDQRNHEHLTNERDEISEDDIRSVRTNVDEDSIALPDQPKEKPPADEDNEVEEEEIKDKNDNDIDTTWNILEP